MVGEAVLHFGEKGHVLVEGNLGAACEVVVVVVERHRGFRSEILTEGFKESLIPVKEGLVPVKEGH